MKSISDMYFPLLKIDNAIFEHPWKYLQTILVSIDKIMKKKEKRDGMLEYSMKNRKKESLKMSFREIK